MLIDTTRARRGYEREGVEYHFITKAAFDADMQSGKFIEYGEYKDNLYGTRLDSGSEQGLSCGCATRGTEFKPYVVFVRPHICEGQRKPLGSSSSLSSVVTEDELHEMKQSAERMDECSSSWVDYVLVKEDPVGALAELQAVLARVQTECQWVPASWARSST